MHLHSIFRPNGGWSACKLALLIALAWRPGFTSHSPTHLSAWLFMNYIFFPQKCKFSNQITKTSFRLQHWSMGNHWDFDVSIFLKIDRFEGAKPHSPLNSACWASYGLSVGECGKWRRNITEKLSASHSYSCSFLPPKHRKPISQTTFHFASWSSYSVSWWVFRAGWKYTISELILGLRPANERRRDSVMTSLIGWAQT